MRGIQTSLKEIEIIKSLRSNGFSISEIVKETGKSKSIVSKYIKDVKIKSKYKKILLSKRDWNKDKSLSEWNEARLKSARYIKNISDKESLLILASLYWGEGTKRELNIINSDPQMLRVVIICFKKLGIKNSQIKVTIRIYEDINQEVLINYWSNVLKLPKKCFKNVNVLYGKKMGKLPNGMCRIRVEKSSKYFKLIMSLIERIKLMLS